MASFEDLFEELKGEVGKLAQEKFSDLVDAAKKDAQQFLEETQEDFKRWIGLVQAGNLTRDDFAWLAKSKKDLMELAALKEAGKAQIRTEEFAALILDALVGVVFRLLV